MSDNGNTVEMPEGVENTTQWIVYLDNKVKALQKTVDALAEKSAPIEPVIVEVQSRVRHNSVYGSLWVCVGVDGFGQRWEYKLYQSIRSDLLSGQEGSQPIRFDVRKIDEAQS